MTFISLHNHQNIGSIHDAIGRPEQAAKRTKELKQDALALTDHGSCAGLIRHYVSCNDNNIKPILGVEAYFVNEMGVDKNYSHLLLLSKTLRGYHNILKATSIAYTQGYIKKTQRGSMIGAIDWSVLPLLQDVVVTSACVGGVVAKPFLNDNNEVAKSRAERFKSIFGEDFYLEVQLHNNAREMFEKANDYIIELSKELSIPLIATNDTHYVYKDDWTTHKAWLAIGHKMPLANFNYVYDDTYYIKSEEEMKELGLPQESLDNTERINDQIDWIDLNLGYGHIPRFMGLTEDEADLKLIQLTEEGLKRIGKFGDEVYMERAEMELNFIIEKGLSAYFFPIWDAINFANEQDIPYGPGRGSAAGSLVAYAIGLTKANPLEYGLPFGRFLNAGRCQKKKSWLVELEDGEEMELIEDQEYKIREEGRWGKKLGQDLIGEL